MAYTPSDAISGATFTDLHAFTTRAGELGSGQFVLIIRNEKQTIFAHNRRFLLVDLNCPGLCKCLSGFLPNTATRLGKINLIPSTDKTTNF